MNPKHAALVVITAFALSGMCRAETKEEAQARKEHRDLPRKELLYGSNILGETVETSSGEKVGSIKELMIDPKDGKIAFGVVTVHPGFLGMGSKSVAIPWDQFRLSPTRHGYLLDLNRQALVDEPAFDDRDRRSDERRYERTSGTAVDRRDDRRDDRTVIAVDRRDDRPVTEAKDLKHYSGKVTVIDASTGTIQVKKLLSSTTFNCGTGRELDLNRFSIGQEVDVDYHDQEGVNVVDQIRPQTK